MEEDFHNSIEWTGQAHYTILIINKATKLRKLMQPTTPPPLPISASESWLHLLTRHMKNKFPEISLLQTASATIFLKYVMD